MSLRRIITRAHRAWSSLKNPTGDPDVGSPFPPGHFYSPIPSLEDVERRHGTIFARDVELYGIELDLPGQLGMLETFASLSDDPAFYAPNRRKRYDIDNGSFTYDDAPILHYMMRLLKPKRIVEIGCGHSSACMLDTSDLYLDGAVEFTFIDVNCDPLRTLLLEADHRRVELLETPVQDVEPAVFDRLAPDDLLFVDSSHVLKIGSDVHSILFDILPRLKKGVCIHFHDVRYPFQYPENLTRSRIYWNEAYVLRAFLQNNDRFKIRFWLNYLLNANHPGIEQRASFLPLDKWDERFNESRGDYTGAGGSIYLMKTR